MLDKKDLKAIKKIVEESVDTKIKNAFSEFWHKVLVPFLDQEHEEIMGRFDKVDEHLTDHRRRIEKLEASSSV